MLGWALRPASRTTKRPLNGRLERPWRRIAFRRLLVAQTLLLRPQRFVLARAGHPTANLKRVVFGWPWGGLARNVMACAMERGGVKAYR